MGTKLHQGWGWVDKDWDGIRDGDWRGQGMSMRGTWAGASGTRNGVRGLGMGTGAGNGVGMGLEGPGMGVREWGQSWKGTELGTCARGQGHAWLW